MTVAVVPLARLAWVGRVIFSRVGLAGLLLAWTRHYLRADMEFDVA